MDAVAPPPLIHGQGTRGVHWRRWLQGETMKERHDWPCDPGAMLTVIAPHPDDEVLMCGGLLQRHLARGGHCRVVGVTDGDRSHEMCRSWIPEALARVRRQESREGLRLLAGSSGAERLHVVRLGLPDGGLSDREDELFARLEPWLAPRDVVITTWRHDGHPDHDVTGRSVARAARRCGALLMEAPVWMWHWAEPGDFRVPWRSMFRAPLHSAEIVGKNLALKAHRTQLMPRPRAAGPPLEPVLGDEIVQRAAWPEEYFICERTP